MAAATYLKNFTNRWLGSEGLTSEARHEFRNQLVQALLRADLAVLKVLVEAFRFIVIKDFVEENMWPELVPELKLVIQNSDLLSERGSQWKTVPLMHLQFFKQLSNPSRGRFVIKDMGDHIYEDIRAHFPGKIFIKAYNTSKALPEKLQFRLINRLDIWPKIFRPIRSSFL